MEIEKILFLSVINEILISELKKMLKKKSINWDYISLITGILLALILNGNIYFKKGYLIVSNLVYITFVGFVIARGSNFLFKIINTLDYKKEQLKQITILKEERNFEK